MTTRLLAIASLALLMGMCAMVGCKQESSFDPNYQTNVKMTDEQKSKEKEIMNQQATDSAGGSKAASAEGVPLPPGKGGR